jgi:hypothetical protein
MMNLNHSKYVAKQERLSIANRAIAVISAHGRKFFSLSAEGRTVTHNRISRFELRAHGQLWFVDKYTQKSIYTSYRRGRWRGFSEGGTLRALVCEMADYISGKRKDFPVTCFGPWPEWVCGGDLWGYGEDMKVVRDEIHALVSGAAQ